LNFEAGRVDVNNRISGGGTVLSAGALGVAGLTIISANLTTTGTLHIDIAGPDSPQHDWLLVGGAASLSGVLDVEVAPGFSRSRH